MSSSELSPRPAFRDYGDPSEVDRPPLSRLAIAAFIAGLFSLLAAFSVVLLPLAMVALGMGIVAVWKLSRDRAMAGRWLAQIGLALSAAAGVWSISSRMGVDQYMYLEAGQHARFMLQTLSGGNIYDALELKKPENAPPLTGTNLELYYTGLREEEMRGIEEFRKNPLTQSVIAAGPSADWQFSRGISVTQRENQFHVYVEMVNHAPQGKLQAVQVHMTRQTEVMSDPEKFHSTALWNFEELIPLD